MSKHQTVVSEYAELEADSFLRSAERDAVARELNEIGERADWEVVVMEEWLIDDKAVESIPECYRVFSGRVERDTDKAVLLSQGQDEDWVPKSCSQSYVLAPGAEIDVPQHSLGAFADGGGER
jgi:hypothetical protein